MSDEQSRRRFLKWLGTGASAVAAGGLAAGCTDAGAADPQGSAESDGGDSEPGDSEIAEGEDGSSGETCRPTGDDFEGPFHETGAPERNALAPDDEPGERIVIEGTVYRPDCTTPVPGAMLDVWHANAEGEYYDASEDYRLRGQLQTDDEGRYMIRTIKPGRYAQTGGLRPAHVHFIVTSPEFGALTTQMYFAGDPYLGSEDSCGGCGSDDPTLIVDFHPERRGGREILVGAFDIILEI